jgi:hypothetical protein
VIAPLAEFLEVAKQADRAVDAEGQACRCAHSHGGEAVRRAEVLSEASVGRRRGICLRYVRMRTYELLRGMSALGQKQTLRNVPTMSALPPKADICMHDQAVRLGPIAELLVAFRSNALSTDA